MHTPNRDEIHAAYQQGEGAIVQLINQLIQELQQTPLPLWQVNFGDTTVVIQDCVRLVSCQLSIVG